MILVSIQLLQWIYVNKQESTFSRALSLSSKPVRRGLCKSFAVLGMVILVILSLFCPQRMRIRITVFQSHYELGTSTIRLPRIILTSFLAWNLI